MFLGHLLEFDQMPTKWYSICSFLSALIECRWSIKHVVMKQVRTAVLRMGLCSENLFGIWQQIPILLDQVRFKCSSLDMECCAPYFELDLVGHLCETKKIYVDLNWFDLETCNHVGVLNIMSAWF